MGQEPGSNLVSSVGRGAVGFVAGATYPLRALAMLRQTPALRGYVLIPMGVNVVVGATLYAGLLFAGFSGIDGLIANLPAWAAFLGLLLRILLVIGLLLGTGLLLLQFGVVLGSPWYGKLSEEIEQLQTGKPLAEIPSNLGGAFRDVWRSLMYELKKLLILGCVGIPLLLCHFFPGIGTAIGTIGGIALATTLVCLDFLDPALERRRLRFRDKLGVIFSSLPASATFGLTCLGLVSIPLLNLLAIPVCVSAGTLFFCDRILQDPQISRRLQHKKP